MSTSKQISILGSTGSVGQNTLEVVESLPGFELYAISGFANLAELQSQAVRWPRARVVAADPVRAQAFPFEPEIRQRLATGPESLIEMVTAPEVDLVVSAIVGRAGLEPTLAAVQAGKTVALANKETLVVAGSLVMREAERTGARLLPVDSEHSAVFQGIQAGRRDEITRIVLTASGGPFRDTPVESLATVTPSQALAHPTWEMGPKISIDSATMMNKALEIIEARWLFGLSPNQIQVVIHPQSIIHSLVEFRDGSVIAQLSPPDMKLPIQYALTWPERVAGPSPKLDFSQPIQLDLQPPDLDKFPALELGYRVAASGGTAGAVLNAANEAAVSAFLDRRIAFADIVTSCAEVLNQHHYEADPSLDTLLDCDRWARKEISKWITC